MVIVESWPAPDDTFTTRPYSRATMPGTIDRLTIKLGEQDVSDRLQHGFGSAFEQVGKADVELSLAEADSVIDGDESIETNMHRRRGRAGTEFAIGFVKDFGELWGHVERRVAEAAISSQPSAISLQ